VGLYNRISEAPRDSMKQLFLWVFDKTEWERLIEVAAAAWALWTARNDVVFKDRNPKNDVLAQSYVKMVKEAVDYSDRVGNYLAPRDTKPLEHWEPPLRNMLKIIRTPMSFDVLL